MAEIRTDASIDFLFTEAETGLTFISMALKAEADPIGTMDNVASARKAYDTILRFKDRVRLDRKQRDRLDSRLVRLRLGLLSLGEKI
jgi:hypothetical protein